MKKCMFFVISIGIICAAYRPSFLGAKELSPEAVVAIVEGVNITYKQIVVGDEDVKFINRINKGQELSTKDIAKMRLEKERQKLNVKIRGILKNKAMEKLGITVKETEVKAKFYDIHKGADINEMVKKANGRWLKLNKALRETLENPGREREIYDTYLVSLMTYEAWKGYRNYYNTLDKINAADKDFPRSVEDYYDKSYPGVEAMLLDEKLKAEIIKTYPISDDEVELFLANNRDKNIKIEDRIKIKEYLALQKWWNVIYKTANIQIKIAPYKEVKKSFQSKNE